MKKTVLTLVFVLLTPVIAGAAASSDFPPGTPGGAAGPKAPYLPEDVPLTKNDVKALDLNRRWVQKNLPPVMAGGGKITYVHGAVIPTIIGTPLQVCDVELQPGEKVREIVVGDSSRWLFDSGTAGSGPNETVHLYIKPVDIGLVSSAVVTTDRRVYHFRLVSRSTADRDYTPYVGFTYAAEIKKQHIAERAAAAKAEHWQSMATEGAAPRDLAGLNFAYRISGKTRWKPERVYDDGRQTFIQFPASSGTREVPLLLVRKASGDVLVNYRIKGTTMIADGVFDRFVLVIGVGRSQEKIEVRQGS